MERVAKPEIIELSPNQAERWLRKYGYDFTGQRNVRPRLTNHYANEMRNGEFYAPTIMLAEQSYNDNKTVMLNGHHTLESAVQANKKIFVVVERWRVDSPDDENSLYLKFDGTGHRTLGNFVRATAASLNLPWPVRVCSAIVTAAIFKEGKYAEYPSEKAKILRYYTAPGNFFNSILGGQQGSKHLRRAAVYYSMLITWEKCQKDAETFWIDVKDGEKLTKKMPAYLLRDFLLTHYSPSGRGSKSLKGITAATSHEMASRCITAWNAFRKDKKISVIKYYPDKSIPRPI